LLSRSSEIPPSPQFDFASVGGCNPGFDGGGDGIPAANGKICDGLVKQSPGVPVGAGEFYGKDSRPKGGSFINGASAPVFRWCRHISMGLANGFQFWTWQNHRTQESQWGRHNP